MKIKVPFEQALGPAAAHLGPKVKDHFLMVAPECRYRGVMHRVWRQRGWKGCLALPWLQLGAWMETLFIETGENVPFELRHAVTPLPDGRATMTWERIFHFPQKPRRFTALMIFDPGRNMLVDWLGRMHLLEVELHARVSERALILRSGRQWLKLGPFKLPLPSWLSGSASIHEWQRPDGLLGIRVIISNPILGEFFGYEGAFDKH